MAQILYELLNWQYFWALFIAWVVLCLFWVSRWTSLLERIGTLIVKPLIFVEDPKPDEPPLYPRIPLEQLARTKRTNISEEDQLESDTEETEDEEEDKGFFAAWVEAQREKLFDPLYPFRTVGAIVFLVAFIIFLIADAISVANTLQVLGLLTEDLPSIFQRFDLAIFGGALLAAIMGLAVLFEVIAENSSLTDMSDMGDSQKSLIKLISFGVILFSVVVMVAFAWQRLIILGYLQETPTANVFLSAVLYGLVPINTAFAAGISFIEAVKGFSVILILLSILLIAVLPLLAFIIDILWRFIYIVVDAILWFIVTPILAIPYGIVSLYRKLFPVPQAPAESD